VIRSIITDIEGTTTPISFVHRVLFPYARERLHDYLAAHPEHPGLINVPEPKFDTLISWMDRDEKITSLKSIQGEIWDEGFKSGDLLGEVYIDVPPVLKSWSEAGIRLFVYSSGSKDAQRLLFGHTVKGNITSRFEAFFDTTIGAKKECCSYKNIIRTINCLPNEVLFLSDVEAELDAAAAAGLSVCHIVRLEENTLPSDRYPLAHNFYDVSNLFGLP
jgi:enolase-phosphatase E1